MLRDPHRYDDTLAVLRRFGASPADPAAPRPDSPAALSFTYAGGDPGLLPVLRALDDAGIEVHDIGSRAVTLDDAFLALTGNRSHP